MSGVATISSNNRFIIRFRNTLARVNVPDFVGTSGIPGLTVVITVTATGGFASFGQATTSGTIFLGDFYGGRYAQVRSGQLQQRHSRQCRPAPAAQGVFDTTTSGGDRSERVAQVFLAQGRNLIAQINTGAGTLAFNPASPSTDSFHTVVFPDVEDGSAPYWSRVTIAGNLDLASAQMPRTRRWLKVMQSPATAGETLADTTAELEDPTKAGLVVRANISGHGGVEKWGVDKMNFSDRRLDGRVRRITDVVGGLSIPAEPLLLASAGTDGVPVLFYTNTSSPPIVLSYAGPITVNQPVSPTSARAVDSLNISGNITLNQAITVRTSVAGTGSDVTLSGVISRGPTGWLAGLREGRFIDGGGFTMGTATTIMDESFHNSGSGGVRVPPAAGERLGPAVGRLPGPRLHRPVLRCRRGVQLRRRHRRRRRREDRREDSAPEHRLPRSRSRPAWPAISTITPSAPLGRRPTTASAR